MIFSKVEQHVSQVIQCWLVNQVFYTDRRHQAAKIPWLELSKTSGNRLRKDKNIFTNWFIHENVPLMLKLEDFSKSYKVMSRALSNFLILQHRQLFVLLSCCFNIWVMFVEMFNYRIISTIYNYISGAWLINLLVKRYLHLLRLYHFPSRENNFISSDTCWY